MSNFLRGEARASVRDDIPEGEALIPRTVAMTDDMWEELNQYAKRHGTSRAGIVRGLIADLLNSSEDIS